MAATRSRSEEHAYRRYLKTVDKKTCVFCDIKNDSKQMLKETKYFKIIRNIFPYSLWDAQEVVDHIMITPKTHTDSLSKMSDKQKVEFVNILDEYEKRGYNVYARAPQSAIKSIIHQHTHLIKTKGSAKSLILLIRKPYLRFLR